MFGSNLKRTKRITNHLYCKGINKCINFQLKFPIVLKHSDEPLSNFPAGRFRFSLSNTPSFYAEFSRYSLINSYIVPSNHNILKFFTCLPAIFQMLNLPQSFHFTKLLATGKNVFSIPG